MLLAERMVEAEMKKKIICDHFTRRQLRIGAKQVLAGQVTSLTCARTLPIWVTKNIE